LSRSVFYQRIQKIEDLLGADLNDGRTLAALHVALVAFGQRADPV
jgi:purine catabolism regulator